MIFGTVRDNVSSAAAHFAQQNNGQAGDVETLDFVRCDKLDGNSSVQSAGGTNYMCRVNY
jgi:hypothetical protein